MFKYIIITPFKKVVESYINDSILLKAQSKNVVKFYIYDLFKFSNSTNHRIDDYAFGGGPGMVLKPEPIFRCFDKLKKDLGLERREVTVIFPTPDGKVLNQKISKNLSENKTLAFICGKYKGIDQRVRDQLVDHEISIGDYVITGGDLSTLVIMDSMIRLIPGVLNNIESANSDSFSNNLLDSPKYTRPESFRNLDVPKVLLSGDHKKIDDWNRLEKEKKTKLNRPDLWDKYTKNVME